METTDPTEELQRNVHENEDIQWVVRPSATARFVDQGLGTLVGGLIGGAILGAITFAVLTIGVPAVAPFTAPVVVPLGIPAAVVVGIAVPVWSLRAHVARWLFGTTEYAATDARIIKFGGVFGRSFSSIPLEGIQDAEYDISTTEKFFDVGTVTLDTKRGYERMGFPYTPSPASFSRELTALARQAREEGTPTLRGEGTYEPGEGVTGEDPAHDLEANVYPDETLLWVITPNKTSRLIRNLPGIVPSAAFTAGFAGAIAFGAVYFLLDPRTATIAGLGTAGLLFLLLFGTSAASYLRGATQYAATDRRIIEYEGRFGKRFDSVPLAGIQDAEYRVSFTENLFDVGTVTLDTDRGYEGMVLSNVGNPADVAREISQLAASDIANRPATDPAEVTVGEGIGAVEPTAELAENIHEDESITWVVGPDKRAKFLADVVGSIPGIALGSLIVGAIAGVAAGATLGPPTGVVVGLGVMVGVALLSLYGPLREYAFDETEYALTEDRLLTYSGAFGRTMSGIPLEGIQDAEYRTDFLEDVFDVGDVTVDTHRGYGGTRLDAVANPAAVAREISELANAHRLADAEGAPQGAAAGDRTGDGETAPGASATGRPASGDSTPADAGGAAAAEIVPASPRKRCPSCEAEIDGTASFCPVCGAEQPSPGIEGSPRDCRECGRRVGETDGFCRHCGASDPVA